MAANEEGFVPKHIEKIVLGIALVVLLGAVMRYGIGTPRSFEIDGEMVTPSNVGKVIAEKAERVHRRITGFVPTPEPIADFTQELAKLQSKPLEGVDVPGVNFGVADRTGLGGVKGPETLELPTLADIQDAMPAPPQPRDWIGTELVVRVVRDDAVAQTLSEEPVWRAGIWYDWRKLHEQWAQALRATILTPEIVCLGYELEIEILTPGGTWEPARDVTPVRRGDVVQPPRIPAYNPSADNAESITQMVNALAQPGWTQYLLQPAWWQILVDGTVTEWTEHFPMAIYETFDDLQQAAAANAAAVPETTPAGPGIPTMPPGADAATRRPGASPRMPEPGMYPPGAAPTPQRPTAATDGGAAFDMPSMPTVQEQQNLGVWLAWFHTNKIQYNRVYRCRMRLKFVNPLLTHPTEVAEDNKADANVPTVDTPWSPWSEPVSVSQQREFYLTGANAAAQTVTVEIFATCLGQRVVKRFSGISPGTTVGGPATVEVVNSLTGEKESRQVDFSTGAIALEFDFSNRIVTPAGIARSDTEMVFLNRDGALKRRSKYFDENSEQYKTLQTEAEETTSRVAPPKPAQPRESDRDRRRRRPARPTSPEGMPPGVEPPDWN